MFDEAVDLSHQFFDAGKRAATDRLLGDEAEPAFDWVQPRGVRRGEMDVVARAPGQPRPDLGVFVGGMVVDDEMDIELSRDVTLDVPWKRQEFLVPVAISSAANTAVVPWRM